jgi:multisubunit Na+/H+ antiporter MnhG subunit
VNVVSWVLLVAGIAIELICCAGVLIARDTPERLHYVAPAGVLGPALVATAILTHESFSQAGMKALLTGCILMAVAPVLTHATGRADFKRRGRIE